MAPTTSAKSAVASKGKKEKVFHPASRKAGQLARHALRKGKLGNLATKRNQKHHSLGVTLCQSSILKTAITLSSRSLWLLLPRHARRRSLNPGRFTPYHW